MRWVVLLLVASPGACGFAARPTLAVHARKAACRAATLRCDTANVAEQPSVDPSVKAIEGVRPPYLLTGYPRPKWRGQKMGWLHKTRSWYLICAAYVLLAWKLPTAWPLSGTGLAFRVIAALASSANIWISDGYHNGDQRGGEGYTPKTETFWLRCDYVGISSVLTSLLWLWSANFGWVGRLRAIGAASGLATALIALISAFVVPKAVGHNAVKGIMAFQFVGLLGYLCWYAVALAPVACLKNSIIFWIYAPGLILYVLKRPKNPVFGFHEMFHTSVLAGHVASMVLDLRNIVSPCAGLCGL